MNPEWETYKRFLIEKLPAYAEKLNPPAEWWEFTSLEEGLGITLPKDFKEIYAINNGEVVSHQYGEWGIMCGVKMLSLDEINEYFLWDTEFEGWIPIFKDCESDVYLGMEVFPDPHEHQGRISLRHTGDSSRNQVIFPSLTAFLKQVNHYVGSGYLYFSVNLESNNEISVMDIREYFEHLLEDLVELLQGKTW